MSQKMIGDGKGKYELMGIDWQEKKWGVPMWGWGAGALAAVYYFFFRKRR
jgi:hypothetical protein